MLDRLLRRLFRHKDALLRVLDRPEIPSTPTLPKMTSALRHQTEISGGTVSEKGRTPGTSCWLAKTCMKLKLSFYDYLGSVWACPVPNPALPVLSARSILTQASCRNQAPVTHYRKRAKPEGLLGAGSARMRSGRGGRLGSPGRPVGPEVIPESNPQFEASFLPSQGIHLAITTRALRVPAELSPRTWERTSFSDPLCEAGFRDVEHHQQFGLLFMQRPSKRSSVTNPVLRVKMRSNSPSGRLASLGRTTAVGLQAR